jgi:hypothetical protein
LAQPFVHILSLAPIFRESAISSSSIFVITNHLVTLYVHAVLFAVPSQPVGASAIAPLHWTTTYNRAEGRFILIEGKREPALYVSSIFSNKKA